ncbi:MAG: STAS domain-containing protein [Sporichthyaceae bacterium]
MDLQVSTARRGSFTVVTVAGDVDLDTAGSLSDEVATATHEETPHLVIDLGGVTFLDSSGLKVLVATNKRTEQAGGSMVLVAVPRVVMRVLTVTALDRVFAIYDTVDDVVRSDP